MTDEYEFTADWFHWAPEVWMKLAEFMPERQAFLEIGSYEGRSAVWIVENLMQDGGWIDCIDTWTGGEEHGDKDMAAVEKRFDKNIEIVRDKYFAGGLHANNRRVYKNKCTSVHKLSRLLVEHRNRTPLFDFVYIDGSHIAKDVLTDACMAWPLLKSKGIMAFDDYLWGDPRDILHRPKQAVDAFVDLNGEGLEIVHVGYQMIVRKK